MELILENDNIPTICLNMIVKNESKIITRLLDSVITIIDTYCICDTGSTDNTIEIIKNYFKEKKISGKIVEEPFKNFCYNRNIALKECIEMSDFILLLDADMILDIKLFNKNILTTAESFYIIQGNESFYYQNIRIIKNNGLFKYIGVTHEYIDIPENTKINSIDKSIIFIKDIGDGGCKNDKYERDVKLLLEGIKNEPNNVRYYFYLANSYHDLGRFGEAINVYKKRIEFDGWREEVWYSYYRIGLCFKNINKYEDAIFNWLKSFDLYPERLESLYEIISFYRINSNHKLCKIFYDIAKNILDKNFPRDTYLFLFNDVYTYKLYHEYSIFASYLGIKNINNEIIKILNNSNNENDNNNLLMNMKFYKDILNKENYYIIDNNINHKLNNEDINFVSSSSCLIKNENDGYYLNIRYVNYLIDTEGNYKNCEKNIISINKFIHLDNNFKIKNEFWMNLIFDNRLYIGIEDTKIFYDNYEKNLKYIGTYYHLNNTLGIVSGKYDIEKKEFEIIELNNNFNNLKCEKNWVFVDYNNSLHIIYDWYPIKICKLENNILKIIETKQMPKIFNRVRGSTCGFNYINKIEENNNGNIIVNISETEIWFVCHLVSYESPRHYYHLISVFDLNMNLLRYSAPFKFEGEPIEYCLSILVEKEQVLINYSTWDRTTRIGIYNKKYIESKLIYN